MLKFTKKRAEMSLETNLKKLSAHLKQNFPDGVVYNHVNGESKVSISKNSFETFSPCDMHPLANVQHSNEEDVNEAVKASLTSFADWRDLPGKDRRKLLLDVATGIKERAEEIALIESMDTGQAIKFMSKAAVRGAENFVFFAEKAVEARDGNSLLAPQQINITSRSPIGPVGVITPWNTPFMLSTWKIAPALAAGCTVVHKPAELSPLTAKILLEIAEDAGLPPGVWNIINGYGETTGRYLTEHPDIKAISFVGESETGKKIMRQGSETLKRNHFELGGKNPVIVFEDADIENAVEAVAFMIFSLNGERCTSSSRLIIHSSIKSIFIEKLKKIMTKIKIGHPLDSETVVGPLISPEHERKVCSYFKIAKSEGASIEMGGSKVLDGDLKQGCYVLPTLFTDASENMRISQEEIFGPVLTVIVFDNEDEAIRIANNIKYGLAGYIWTQNLSKALRVSEKMNAGMIWINSENVRHLPTPFGGTKDSGIGRDGGDWSFDFYMETKNICLPTANKEIRGLTK